MKGDRLCWAAQGFPRRSTSGQKSKMDRFRMIFQYLQSNSESVMNGICGLLALASVKIYTSFDFSCPCLPRYNMAYGLGIMFIPPVTFFFCGLILNRQSLVMLEEWSRPQGSRKKDLAVIRWGLHREWHPSFHLLLHHLLSITLILIVIIFLLCSARETFFYVPRKAGVW